MAARLAGIIDPDRVLLPVLDESFEFTSAGARRRAGARAPRLAPEQVARLDWHTDVSRLILDINGALAAAADERSREVLIRRLRLDDVGAEAG